MGWFVGADISTVAHSIHDVTVTALVWLDGLLTAHRVDVLRISTQVKEATNNPITKVVGAAMFILISLPNRWRDAVAFYQHAMKPNPIAAYRKGGIKDTHIALARRILFFYVLYLVYQIIVYPYSFIERPTFIFYVDIVFQVGILIALFESYSSLKFVIHHRWEGDADGQKEMDKWLNKSLDGLNVKPGQLRSLAVSVFTVNFAPAFVASAPLILDALSKLNQSAISALTT